MATSNTFPVDNPADKHPLRNGDILRVVANFVGGRPADSWFSGLSPPKGSANNFYFKPVSRSFRDAWGLRSPYTAVTKSTTVNQLLSGLHNGLSIWTAGRYVAKLGCLPLVKALQSRGYQLSSTTCEAAAHGGQKRLLLWLRMNGCTWDTDTFSGAAQGGHPGLLRYLRGQGCPGDVSACDMAAYGGHLGVLKWLRRKGYPWGASTCTAAAGQGHLEVLRWARENGCAWSTNTSMVAAKEGHLPVLVWLYDNHCPWEWQTILEEASAGDHYDVVDWARMHAEYYYP